MAQMIRMGTLIYIEKWCLIAVINMVKYIVYFLLTLFILLLFWLININSSFIFNSFQSWLNCDKQIITWHFPCQPWYHPSTHISPQLLPWADMGVSGWYQGRYGKCHVIIYIYLLLYLIVFCFHAKHLAFSKRSGDTQT
jgi:hypothetical protein